MTVLDQDRAGTAGAMIDEATANAAMAVSRARGYLDGRALAEVFAWLRPDDLIWNYWVNNYLQGKTPPPFDILYWNADTTRLPAALHADFIRLALANALTVPDAATMLGSPVDLSKVDVDAYVIAGVADHLCPWQSCYRTTQMLGGATTFVLSTSGHIASMVNPPGNPKATFHTAADNPARPARLADYRAGRQRQLVAALLGLAGRAQRRAAQGQGQARQEGLRRARRRLRERMSTTGSLRTVAVGDQLLRVSIRPARANRRRDAARVAAASHAGNAGSPAPAPSAGDAAARNGRMQHRWACPCCSSTASGPAWSCSRRSWTRWTRRWK